jgi:simple sugar transport system ATP-binding protein
VCEQLDVRDDRGLPAIRGVSLSVRAGEIVGVAGVEGNGQHELLEAIAGLRPAHAGRIMIAGHVCTGGARAHRAAGLAHIPSDRLHRGLVQDFTLAENLMLGQQRSARSGRGMWFGGRAMREHALELLKAFDVRPVTPALQARRLSGGNQQKLIAARELSCNAQAILAAHPTRGVDLGAIDFLHRRLLAERDAGRAVLLISSELSELLALSDRVLVLYEGRIVHETTPAATDERTLGLYMTGRSAGHSEKAHA